MLRRTPFGIQLGPLILVTALAAGCGPAPPPAHVVIVLSDALRAANLGCYGYPRPTSPAIDALAREGVLFEQAIAVGGNTSTVVPALFTGHYPFFEYRASWGGAPFGMDRFRRPAPPFATPADGDLTPDEHIAAWKSWSLLKGARAADHPAELEYMTAAYESGTRRVDDVVRAIVGFYRDHGLLDRTLFVFTADHGDEFLEHGATSHTGTLFEEIVHVPLIVVAPGGRRNAHAPELVRSFDVTATVLDYAGLAATTEELDARSLRPALDGSRLRGTRTVFASFPWLRMLRTERYKLLRDDDGVESLYDLVADPREKTDLAKSEDQSVRRAHADLARQLDQTVERLRAEGEGVALPPDATPLDEETRAQLRALGYVE